MTRPHCHKEIPSTRKPRTVSLPAKSTWPPIGETVYWSRLYANVGDILIYRDLRDIENKTGVVTKVVQNKYGRVSYFVGSQLVLLEDLIRAESDPAKFSRGVAAKP